MNTKRFNEAVEYLSTKTDRLPVSSRAKLIAQGGSQLKLKTNDLVIRKEITIGGKISLIDANTKQLPGVSDFDGNKFSDYINHIIDELKFSYDNAATAYAGNEAGLTYAKALPAAIRNAKLNIKQNDVMILSFPVATINNPNTGNNIADDFRQLDNFELLVSGESINLELEFAAGAAIPVVVGSERHFVELVLGGFTTFVK